VNGARAGEPRAEGVPLPLVLREMLERGRTLDEAIEIARTMPVMVSHLVFLADASGQTAVLERSPDRLAVRRGAHFLTNHFFDPTLADDARNREIERTSSTLARYQRLEELAPGISSRAALEAVLRDYRLKGGVPLAPGDRRAIDADIATHS